MRKNSVWLLVLLAFLCNGIPLRADGELPRSQATLVAKAKKGKGGAKSKKKPPLRLDKREVQKKRDLKDNVHSYRDQVWITRIPMVDQGDKGYCVVAVLERMMKY